MPGLTPLRSVAADSEFAYVQQDLKMMDDRIAANTLSLNEKERRKELADNKARKESRIAARAKQPPSSDKVFEITLDNVNKPDLQLAKYDKKPRRTKLDPEEEPDEDTDDAGPKVDPVRTETLHILSDLVELSRAPKTASAK